MSDLKEKNKIVKEERNEESHMLRDFFGQYDYLSYNYGNFRMADSSSDYSSPKEKRTLFRDIGTVNLYTYDFFDMADKLKKIANKLKRKGYSKVSVDFDTYYDESNLKITIFRKETDAEVDARLAKSVQASKNAKLKKDREFEKLKKLAAKKGLKLVKE